MMKRFWTAVLILLFLLSAALWNGWYVARFAQQAAQQPRGLPDYDLHRCYLLSFKHITPQAMSRNATRNIKQPTGNTAAMSIPSPRPSAHTPKKPPQFHLLTVHPSPAPIYGPRPAEVQKGPPTGGP